MMASWLPSRMENSRAPTRATGSPILATCCLSGTRRSEEHTSELQSRRDLVCRLLLEKKKHITVGIGIAGYDFSDKQHVRSMKDASDLSTQLLQWAEAAMQQAVNGGRARVCTWGA